MFALLTLDSMLYHMSHRGTQPSAAASAAPGAVLHAVVGTAPSAALPAARGAGGVIRGGGSAVLSSSVPSNSLVRVMLITSSNRGALSPVQAAEHAALRRKVGRRPSAGAAPEDRIGGGFEMD